MDTRDIIRLLKKNRIQFYTNDFGIIRDSYGRCPLCAACQILACDTYINNIQTQKFPQILGISINHRDDIISAADYKNPISKKSVKIRQKLLELCNGKSKT